MTLVVPTGLGEPAAFIAALIKQALRVLLDGPAYPDPQLRLRVDGIERKRLLPEALHSEVGLTGLRRLAGQPWPQGPRGSGDQQPLVVGVDTGLDTAIGPDMVSNQPFGVA